MTRKEQLRAFLDEIGARLIQTYPAPTGECRFYVNGDGVELIVQITRSGREEDAGFEIFVPATLDDRIEETFAAAKLALEDLRKEKVGAAHE